MTGSIKGPTVTDAMREKGARELCQGSPLETSHDVVERVFVAMAMEATRTATNRASEGETRFFIDHGKIHDRVTGKHVDPTPVEYDEGKFDTSPVEEVCALLNVLSAKPDPEAVTRTELVEALTKCRDKFREYEEQHRIKAEEWHGFSKTEMDKRIEKAERNREMAEMCDALLDRKQAGGAPNA